MSRYLVPALIGLIGAAILVALGVWQVQRLEWKQTVLSEIAAKMDRAPVALPADPTEALHKYVPVRVSARLTGERAAIFVSVKSLGVRFRIIDAAETVDGRRVLIERGTIPTRVLDDLSGGTLDDLAKGGEITVTGMLHWPDEVDAFTPPPDTTTGVMYARDLAVLSKMLNTEPVLIVASETLPVDPVILPLPLDPTAIPNDHLQYAVTWFGLAVVWLGMTAYWIARITRARRLER